MKNKINKNYLTLFSILLAVVFSFFVGNFAYAGLNEVVAGIVGHFVQFLVWILGGILMVLISILIWIAQYNDFIGSPAVTNGWIIVRDLCNMFFILALLVIAFATILKLENYNIKKMLPKLIIMAILINFSKMICGLIIDFAQVIMLTFVDGFKELGGGQLTQMLGIKDILKLDIGLDEKVTLGSVVGSYILALIYTIISVVVVGVIVAVLVIRMIMLWIYIVLSPLAYLLAAVPGGQKYSSQWWSEFTKNVIIGPVLAFFLWLSFASLGNVTPNNIQKDVLKVESKQLSGIEADLASNITTNKVPNAGVAKAGSRENMIMFIISIGMLMGGLVVTQQIGGLAGKAAGKGMATIQKGQGLAQKAIQNITAKSGKAVGRGALGVSSAGLMKLGKTTKSESLTKLGETGVSWRKDLIKNNENRKRDKRIKLMRKMGMDVNTMEKVGELSDTKLGRYSKSATMATTATVVAASGAGVVVPALLAAGAGAHYFASKASKKAEEKKAKRKKEKEKVREEKDSKIQTAKEEKDSKIQKAEKERDNKIQTAEKERNLDSGYQEALLGKEEKLRKIKEDPNLSEELRKDQEERINKNFETDSRVIRANKKMEAKKKSAETEYEEKKKSAETEYNSKIKELDKMDIVEKIFSKDWSPLKDWHPQKVTKAAVKKATKDNKMVESEISGYAEGGEKIQNNGPNNWYSSNGQTDRQKIKLDKLTSGDSKSTQALQNITKELNDLVAEIKTKGLDGVSEHKLNAVDNFKRGVAAFIKGGNDDAGRLNEVIEALNNIPDKDGETKTVDFYIDKDFIVES